MRQFVFFDTGIRHCSPFVLDDDYCVCAVLLQVVVAAGRGVQSAAVVRRGERRVVRSAAKLFGETGSNICKINNNQLFIIFYMHFYDYNYCLYT